MAGIAFDAIWCLAALRLLKNRIWWGVLTIFLAGQAVAEFSLMRGWDWPVRLPQVVIVPVVVWHFFAIAFVLVAATPMGIAWGRRKIASKRNLTKGREASVAGQSNESRALSRRQFLGACTAVAPPLFNIGVTGIALAQLQRLRVRRFTVSIPTLPRALDGLTIAHVTDVHLGGLTTSRVLKQMVSDTNALQPDLIVMTGDLINYELSDLQEGIGLLKAMNSRYGLWMVEGNHDTFDDGDEFRRRVKAAGLQLLCDETAVVQARGYPVQFLGLKWLDGGGPQRDWLMRQQLRAVLRERQPDAFPILLAHHPHALDAAAKAGLPLTLSGHTHGGFWMLDDKDGVGPAVFRYWSGLYNKHGSQMIVANGVGNWSSIPPIRVNAPAEVVHITLRCG